MPQSDWLLNVSGFGEVWTHSTDTRVWLVASFFRFGGGVDAQYRHHNLIGCFMFQVWGRCGRTVQTPQSDWLLHVTGLGEVWTPQSDWLLHVSGLGEVWTHSTDAAKFGQFGWRCTNKESSYSDKHSGRKLERETLRRQRTEKGKTIAFWCEYARIHVPKHTHTHAHTHQWLIYIVNFLDAVQFLSFSCSFPENLAK